jgi:hypothetical protein
MFEAFELGAFAHVAVVPVGGFTWRDDVRPPDAEGARIAWDETPETKGPWLVRAEGMGRRVPTLQTWRLLVDFDRLARNPTPERFAGFAGRFGFLETPTMLAPLSLRGSGPISSDTLLEGERLGDLYRAARLWRDLRECWEDMRVLEEADSNPDRTVAAARRRLSSRIVVTHGGIVRYHHALKTPTEEFVASWTLVAPGIVQEDEIRAYLEPDLVARAGRLYVSYYLNDALRGSVNPIVMPLRGSVVRFFPETLLGAIHIAAMRELSGTLTERPCQECGLLFLVGRRHARYCSRPCKEVAARRRRRQRAVAAD